MSRCRVKLSFACAAPEFTVHCHRSYTYVCTVGQDVVSQDLCIILTLTLKCQRLGDNRRLPVIGGQREGFWISCDHNPRALTSPGDGQTEMIKMTFEPESSLIDCLKPEMMR